MDDLVKNTFERFHYYNEEFSSAIDDYQDKIINSPVRQIIVEIINSSLILGIRQLFFLDTVEEKDLDIDVLRRYLECIENLNGHIEFCYKTIFQFKDGLTEEELNLVQTIMSTITTVRKELGRGAL